MTYRISITPDAREDIRYFKVYEQRIINDGISRFLTQDALVETNRRKPLDLNEVSSWELRIDTYRVFYDVEDTIVYIVAVGHKEHNELFIRGKRVIL
jgi:mRNA-degrading endonuclease RelE of RelBE toxin-antitoxin system